MERKYYLATPGGKSFEAVREWQQRMKDAMNNAFALCYELEGAKEVLRSGDRIAGILFVRDPGSAWRKVRDWEGYYFPHKRHKIGKEIARRIEAMTLPDNNTFTNILGGGGWIVNGNRLCWTSFELVGDFIIITVPVSTLRERDHDIAIFIPPDTKPLKMSEYYALKEAAEAKS